MVPAVNPVTVMVPVPDWKTDPVLNSGLDVAMYEVIIEFPSEVDAIKEMVAVVPLTASAVPIIGAEGTLNAGAFTNSPRIYVAVPPAFESVTLQTKYFPPIFFKTSAVIVIFSPKPTDSVN